MDLIGDVIKMDVDKGDKASGAFLRARVAVKISKPLRRGVFLQTNRSGRKDWFDLQYEKLPFYCKSCGIMGHSELDCENPVPRNALGKLSYDVKRRLEDKRKKVQSFSVATTKSYGSGSSGHSTFSRWTSVKGDNQQSQSNNGSDKAAADEEEVSSPLKESGAKVGQDGAKRGGHAYRPLF